MSEPKRYTLAEAQREPALKECQLHGHSFDVTETRNGGGRLIGIGIRCGQCGWGGRVEMNGPDPALRGAL